MNGNNAWKRFLACTAGVALVVLLLAPVVYPWKWRTHGGVYGTRGIAKVAHDRIAGDPEVPREVKDNLNWEVIRPGSVAPDKWKRAPYYLDRRHLMSYCENRGSEWLLEADDLRGLWETQDVSDSISYYLGIAAHYWAELTQYFHHDNAQSYFENLYGTEKGYDIWDAYHDHLEWQVEFYRPKDPALIVSGGGFSQENRAVDSVHGEDTTGDVLGDAQNDDGITYDVAPNAIMRFNSIDTSGISGSIDGAVLWVEYSTDAGYDGTNAVQWSINGVPSNTNIVPSDTGGSGTFVSDNYDLYAQGVNTLAELEALNIRFESNDAPPGDTVYFDYVWVEVEWSAVAGAPYTSLDAFLSDARDNIYEFIDRTMPPNDPMGGWLGDWIESRKCEEDDYSIFSGNPGADVHYGSKELVDMATELIYSGWVYALGIQYDVSADRITWDQWWSRGHREPGISYLGF